MNSNLSALFNCKGGGGKKPVIEHRTYAALVFSGNCKHGKPFKLFCEREQYNRAEYIESGMNNSNTEIVGPHIEETEADNGIKPIEQQHCEHRSDKVEIQMDDCSTLCTAVCADRRYESCHAGADILA